MGLKITRVTTPTSKYDIKCPYSMTPEFIVVHNTANKASAMNEVSYMLNNNNQVSYHFAVDYERAVQGLPLNRNGWHAGDGAYGNGNRKGIAIEICHSTNPDIDLFLRSEKNGAILVAMLLKQYGWGIDKVKKHQDFSGKYCPHKTLDLGWQRFLNLVKDEMKGSSSQSPSAKPSSNTKTTKYGVGTPVCTNTLATSSTGGKVYKGDWEGTITKVIPGAPYPYLLNNGTGWTNDAGIDSDPHVPKTSSTSKPSSSNTKFKVGDWVGVKKGAKDYNGNPAGGVVRGKIYYTIDELKGDRAVLDIPGICTAFHTKDLFK